MYIKATSNLQTSRYCSLLAYHLSASLISNPMVSE